MNAPSASTFGKLLKRYRAAAGLTQEELAERAGLSVEGISALERGVNRSPRRDTVDLLADALALAPADHAAFTAAARTASRPGAATPLPAAIWPAPLAPGGAPPPLLGRAHDLARIERHLAGDGPPVLLLSGEPGIGKSRLLYEAAERAPAAGWTLLAESCHRRSGQEPFAPLLGALQRSIAGLAANERAALEGCAWLSRLLPELAGTVAVPAVGWELPPEQERRLMFAAVARYLANVAGPAGTLLVLDDLQWAGADALDLLAALVQSSSAPLRVLAAYRATDVSPHDALAALLADLAREGSVEDLPIEPLGREAASSLLNDLLAGTSDPQPAVREQVVRATGGVPFFLISYAQGLRTGALGAGSLESVPWNAAQTIRQRVAALTEPARELIGMAAVAGDVVTRRVLLAAGTQAEPELLAALDAACHARLLVEEGEGGYRFAHELIREVVAGDLSAARRAVLHRRLADAVEHLPGTPPDGLLAYHAVRAGEQEKAVLYLERAGDRAAHLYAYAEAEGYYRELVGRLDSLGDTAEAARAREKLGGVLRATARYPAALETLDRAARTFAALEMSEDVGRVTALIGQVHSDRGAPAEGVARLRPVIEALTTEDASPAVLAGLHDALAQLLHLSGSYDEQLAASVRAAELARASGDKRLLAQVEMRRGNALRMLGRLREAAGVLEAAVDLLAAAGDTRTLAHALDNVSMVYLLRGELDRTANAIARALALAEEVGDPLMVALMIFRRGMNSFAAGAWADAQRDFERAAVIVREVGVAWVSPYAAAGRGILSLAQGRYGVAADELDEAVALAELSGDMQALRWAQGALAERDLLDGRPDAATSRLEPLLDRPGQQEGVVTYLLPLVAWAALDRGDEVQAAAVLDECLARAVPERILLGQVDALRVLAALRLRQNRRQDAEAALNDALTLSRALPYPYAEAKALYVYGQLHSTSGEPAQARGRFKAALAICRGLGERLYADRIERALDSLSEG
jgi:transcriptional regulator with XRE-family HTH domain/tetratricopeptide (TPR) repeat protein